MCWLFEHIVFALAKCIEKGHIQSILYAMCPYFQRFYYVMLCSVCHVVIVDVIVEILSDKSID